MKCGMQSKQSPRHFQQMERLCDECLLTAEYEATEEELTAEEELAECFTADLFTAEEELTE